MNEFQDYCLPEIGTTENILTIKLLNYLQTKNKIEFFQSYKISNYWRGKYFIKRLINKVFKYKLKENMSWNKKFWDHIQIQLIEAKISLKENIEHNNLISNYSQKRQVSILKYKSMIDNKVDLGSPLFISGQCINLIGGNVNVNEIYMLDGSRRLIASLLSNKLDICIWLITINE